MPYMRQGQSMASHLLRCCLLVPGGLHGIPAPCTAAMPAALTSPLHIACNRHTKSSRCHVIHVRLCPPFVYPCIQLLKLKTAGLAASTCIQVFGCCPPMICRDTPACLECFDVLCHSPLKAHPPVDLSQANPSAATPSS